MTRLEHAINERAKLRNKMEKEGFHITARSNGRIAMEIVVESCPDYVRCENRGETSIIPCMRCWLEEYDGQEQN